MSKKTAVVLVNLGAPSTLDEVQPFLKNLFSDPDIFHFPFGKAGQSFFSSMISAIRAPKSKSFYASIGGGSPLRKITEKQGELLAKKLLSKGDFTVFTSQRYWHPFIHDIIVEVEKGDYNEILLLPMYPQYSTTTTQSVINEWNKIYRGNTNVRIINRFYNHPVYLKTCIGMIVTALQNYDQLPHLLFTAHSIPVSRVKNGDTYQIEIEDHVRLIMSQLPESMPYTISYQSKVGPEKWLEPTVEQALDQILATGETSVLVFPISFVAENLETLYELDIQKKDIALKKGIISWNRVPAMDLNEGFIQTLADIIIESDT